MVHMEMEIQDLFDSDWMEISGSADLGPVGLTVGYFTDAEALYVEAAFPIGAVDIGVGFGSDSKDRFLCSEVIVD